MTMSNVEAKKPTRPLVKSLIKMEINTFTATFPKSKEHRRRFPSYVYIYICVCVCVYVCVCVRIMSEGEK
jgi:hypothetical protein